MRTHLRNIRFFFKNIRLSFDRSFSSGRSKQLMWLVGLMAIVYLFLVALSHLTQLYTPSGSESDRWSDILFVLIDPGGGSESMTPAFSIIVAIFGLVIFGGMLISMMSNALERRVESYTNGETDYKLSNHIVVIGFNSSVPSLLQKINKDYPDSHILLMSAKESDFIRDYLHSCLDDSIENSIVVLRGVQTAKDDISRLSLKNAPREIFVLGEEDDECHDSNGLECTKLISEQMLDNKNRVTCHVQIDSDTTYSVLQRVDFCKEYDICQSIVFQPFNFNEIWAQKAIATVDDEEFKPLDDSGITPDSKKHVHLIVVGTNEMATSIAVNAAHILHFPNYIEGNFSTCSHITFIDNDISNFAKKFRLDYHNLFELSRWREVGSEECNNMEVSWIDPIASFDSNYKHLGDVNFMDIQWEFISGDIYDEKVQEYLFNCSSCADEITTIALCSESSEQNASFCMALSDDICKNAHQVLVRQRESKVTVDLIQKLPNHENVKAFGMITECYGENLISDKYGKLINALYSGISDFTKADEIQEKWENCSILNKWSSIYSANMLFTKLRSLGFSSDFKKEDIDAILAKQEIQDSIQRTEHNRWNTERLLLGFAPVKQEEQEYFKQIVGDKSRLKMEKKDLAEAELRHLDICSNRALSTVDPYVVVFDNVVNDKLWELRKYYKDSTKI